MVRKSIRISRRDFLKLSGAGLTGAALLGVAGCGGGETIGGGQGSSGKPQPGGTFTFGRGADSVGLDPINVTDGESLIVGRQVFDSLLDFAPEATDVVPALAAERPEPQNNGLRYVFKLREDVKFHDGTPFNAEAVVFNFDRWRNTGNPFHKGGGSQSSDFAYFSSMFAGFDGDSIIENVEATGEYEVTFTLKAPQGPFLSNIAMSPFGIASPKAIKENVENFWQNPVGTGPFKFVSWNKGSTVELEKNPDWWGSDLPVEEGGGGPYLDKVIFRSIPDNTSRVAALAGGQLSGADGLTPDDIPTVKQDPNLKIQYRPPLNVGYLAMHTQKEPFTDPKVRQAVNYAINMPKIIEAFFGDTGQNASNPMPPTVPFFNEKIEPYPYDPDKAKQLLEEAGVGGGFDTDLWYMPIPRPYMPDGKGVAQAMQQDLKKVGINADLVTREWGTYIEETGSGAHQMALLGWTGDNGDPDNFLNVLLSGQNATPQNAQNIAYYDNSEVNDLLAEAQRTIDEEKRRELYYEAQRIIHEDAPWATIAYAKPPLGFQNRVQDYKPSPTGGEPFNTVWLAGGGG